MTAKEQVLKVYQKARCKAFIIGDHISEYVVWNKGNIIGVGGNSKSAWQSALTKINENGTQKDRP